MTAPARDLAAAAAAAADPAALLTLVQWLSPAFPTGAFAWSGGMETAIAAGQLTDAASAERWIADVLEFGSARGDAILLAHALRPDADFAALSDRARALAPTAERLRETGEQGAAFALAVAGLQDGAAAQGEPAIARRLRASPPSAGAADRAPSAGTRQPDAVAVEQARASAEAAADRRRLLRGDPCAAPLPVALGRAAAPLGLPVPLVLALFLQSVAGNLVTVAVRFVPLGQSEGQRILSRLRPVLVRLAAEAAAAPLSAIASATLGADIASARHETLPVRMFRS